MHNIIRIGAFLFLLSIGFFSCSFPPSDVALTLNVKRSNGYVNTKDKVVFFINPAGNPEIKARYDAGLIDAALDTSKQAKFQYVDAAGNVTFKYKQGLVIDYLVVSGDSVVNDIVYYYTPKIGFALLTDGDKANKSVVFTLAERNSTP